MENSPGGSEPTQDLEPKNKNNELVTTETNQNSALSEVADATITTEPTNPQIEPLTNDSENLPQTPASEPTTGHALNTTSTDSTNLTNSNNVLSSVTADKQKKTNRIVLIITAVLLLLGAIGVAVYAIIEHNKPENILLNALIKASKQNSIETTLAFDSENIKKNYEANEFNQQIIDLLSNAELKILSQVDTNQGLLKNLLILRSSDKEVGSLRFELDYKELEELLFKVDFSDSIKQEVRDGWLEIFLSQLDGVTLTPTQKRQAEQEITKYANQMLDDFEQNFLSRWLKIDLAKNSTAADRRCLSTVINELLTNQPSDNELLHAYKNSQIITIANETTDSNDDTLVYDATINYKNIDKLLKTTINQNKMEKMSEACSESSEDNIDSPKTDDDFEEIVRDYPQSIQIHIDKKSHTISRIVTSPTSEDSVINTITVRFGADLPQDQPKDIKLFSDAIEDFSEDHPEFVEGFIEGYTEAIEERSGREQDSTQTDTNLFDRTIRNLF